MSGLALALVLAAAFGHATWNLLAKRAGGSTAFNCLFTLLNVLIYLPLTLGQVIIQRPQLGLAQWGFIAVSTGLQTVYFFLLFRGYQSGDLSLVYPLARSTGPLLAAGVAIAFFGERPSGLALAGAGSILIGAFLIAGSPRKLVQSGASRAVAFALLTGVIIATYTIWDKQAVASLAISPILLNYFQNLGRLILLAPFTRRHWDLISLEWRSHRLEALGVGLLMPLAYILVLIALTISPVSYVAPAREISILIGTIMGARLLAEAQTRRRLAAAGAMVAGVIALALG